MVNRNFLKNISMVNRQKSIIERLKRLINCMDKNKVYVVEVNSDTKDWIIEPYQCTIYDIEQWITFYRAVRISGWEMVVANEVWKQIRKK